MLRVSQREGDGLDLRQALGIGPETLAVFMGNGDQTAIILRLLQECVAVGLRTVYTAASAPVPPRCLDVVPCTGVGGTAWARAVLDAGRPCLVHGGIDADGRLAGLTPDRISALLEIADVVLVAVDRRTPLPRAANLLVPILDSQGTEPLAARTAAAGLLAQGGDAAEHPACRVVPLLNVTDDPGDAVAAYAVAEALLAMGVGRVVVSTLASAEPVRAVLGPVAGVVLAAGSSRRWRQGHKLLHPIAGRPMLVRSLAAPLGAGLREVVLVTGARHDEIAAVVKPYPVRVVHNPQHESGMAGSMQAALSALFPQVGSVPEQPPPVAVVLFLADQPHLTSSVVDRLIARWRETGAPVVAPYWNGRWRNPVLFSADLVPELMATTGDEGGRRVVQAHLAAAELVPFAHGDLFRDIDTPEDLGPARSAAHDR